MKALTVVPLKANTAALSDISEPPESDGPVLVETIAIGVCGTDIEIVSGAYGWPPPGEERLVLGHESLDTTTRYVHASDRYAEKTHRDFHPLKKR